MMKYLRTLIVIYCISILMLFSLEIWGVIYETKLLEAISKGSLALTLLFSYIFRNRLLNK